MSTELKGNRMNWIRDKGMQKKAGYGARQIYV